MLDAPGGSFGIRYLNSEDGNDNLDPSETLQFYLQLGKSLRLHGGSHLKVVITSSEYEFEFSFDLLSPSYDGFLIGN